MFSTLALPIRHPASCDSGSKYSATNSKTSTKFPMCLCGRRTLYNDTDERASSCTGGRRGSEQRLSSLFEIDPARQRVLRTVIGRVQHFPRRRLTA